MESHLKLADTELLFSSECMNAKIDCYKQIAYHLCKAAKFYLIYLNKMLGNNTDNIENVITLLRRVEDADFMYDESKIIFIAAMNEITALNSSESCITYNDVIQLRINVTELKGNILDYLTTKYKQNMLTQLKFNENESEELRQIKRQLIPKVGGDFIEGIDNDDFTYINSLHTTGDYNI